MKKDHADIISIDVAGIDERACIASEDSVEFERILKEYTPFLRAQVSRLTGSRDSNDLFDEMMNDASMAFYESVKAYSREKGHFFPLMRTVVHKRLLDSLRKKYSNRIQTVPLETDDEEEMRKPSLIDSLSVSASRENERRNDLVVEIECYKRELSEWGLSMDMLVANSPKHTRLRDVCRQIINAVAADEEIMEIMWTKKYFPIKKISELVNIPQKTIERVRTFIIGSLIIRAGDYEQLKEYVMHQAM